MDCERYYEKHGAVQCMHIGCTLDADQTTQVDRTQQSPMAIKTAGLYRLERMGLFNQRINLQSQMVATCQRQLNKFIASNGW